MQNEKLNFVVFDMGSVRCSGMKKRNDASFFPSEPSHLVKVRV